MVIDQFDLETVALAPAGVHALEHPGPVLAFGAARSGIDFDIGTIGVGLACEQCSDLVALRTFGKLGKASHTVVDQVLVAFGLRELDELSRIGKLAFDRTSRADRMLEPLAFPHDFLRGLGIVPESRVFDLGVELVEPPDRAIPVDEPPEQRRRRIDLVDMSLRFGAHRKEPLESLFANSPIRACSALASYSAAEPKRRERRRSAAAARFRAVE